MPCESFGFSILCPRRRLHKLLGKQLLRSGTSVGAHYREGHRARSTAEFISKLKGALQELEESAYWLELLIEGRIMPENRLAELVEETNQLIAIFVTCVKHAKES
jgi:four helix bundle protein